MSEYLKRHQMFLNNNPRLLDDLRDLNNLLQKYEEFKTNTPIFSRYIACGFAVCGPVGLRQLLFENMANNLNQLINQRDSFASCGGPECSARWRAESD